MLDLNERQRSVLIEKLPDTANVAAGGMLFGQAISGQPFSTAAAIAGLAVWAGILGYPVFLARSRK